MDKRTKEQRRKNMQAVRDRDSEIELLLRRALWRKGYRYRKNLSNVEGKPDLAFVKQRLAIFCDSEFWHGYDWENKKGEFKSNQEFWHKKIETNMKRDQIVNEKLTQRGWTVLRFWGRDIKANLDECVRTIEKQIIRSKLPEKENSFE